MRSHPAANPFALQISIEPSSKTLIFVRIAQKTGVVLNGTCGQGTNIFDKRVIQSCTSKKGFWDVSLRTFKGTGTDIRWAKVLYRFQSFDRAQINVSEMCPSNECSAELGSAELGFAEGGTSEVGITEVGTSEVSPDDVGPNEGSFAEVGPDEGSSTEVSPDEDGPDEGSFAEVGPNEGSFTEVSPAEIGSTEVSSAESSTAESSSAEVGSTESGSAESGKAEVRSAKVNSDEVGSAKVNPDEVGSDEVGNAVEIGIAEVNNSVSVLCSPLIPCSYTLLKNLDLFLYRHMITFYVYCSHYRMTDANRQGQNDAPNVRWQCYRKKHLVI